MMCPSADFDDSQSQEGVVTFNHRSVYSLFVHLASTILALTVFLISSENRRLEAKLNAHLERPLIAPSAPGGLPDATARDATDESARGVEVSVAGLAGAPLPEVSGHDLAGEVAALRGADGSRPSILLVFAPSCASCGDNLPRWQELHDRYREQYRVVAISVEDLTSTRTYAEANKLPFSIFLPEDASAFIAAYGITHVPMTVITNAEGHALHARAGVLPRSFVADLPRIAHTS